MKREGIFIGAVSRRTGLSIHTVRFYEAEGLLPESVRTESGYRVFSPQSVEHLKFIRKAQQLGFSLDEIRELLVLRDRSTDACSHVRSLVQEKLANVHKKLQELGAMGKELKLVLAECNRQLKRHRPGRGERCPVLLKHGSISFARVALKTDFGASNRADCGLIMGKREIIADGSLHVGLKADYAAKHAGESNQTYETNRLDKTGRGTNANHRCPVHAHAFPVCKWQWCQAESDRAHAVIAAFRRREPLQPGPAN